MNDKTPGRSTRETEAGSMSETKDMGIFEMFSFLRALDKHMAGTAHPLIIFQPLCWQPRTI